MASFKEIAQSKGVNVSGDKDPAQEISHTPKKRMKRPWFGDEDAPQMPAAGPPEPEAVKSMTLEDAWLKAKSKMTVIKNSQPKVW